MRYPLLLSLILITSSAFAQSYPSSVYTLSKKRKHATKFSILTSQDKKFSAESQRHKAYDHNERYFTFNGKPFRWELHEDRPSILYCADSAVAETFQAIRLGGVAYSFVMPSNKSFAYELNGRQVLRGFVYKDGGGTHLRVDELINQGNHQKYLHAMAAFHGLQIMEARSNGAGAVIGGLILGVGLAIVLPKNECCHTCN